MPRPEPGQPAADGHRRGAAGRLRRAAVFVGILAALAIPSLLVVALTGGGAHAGTGTAGSGGLAMATAAPPGEPGGTGSTVDIDGTGTGGTSDTASTADREQIARGRDLFEEGCAGCHGFDAKGIPERGPSLIGAGELAADFYLRTGRMPLGRVGSEPLRAPPAFPEDEIEALVAYVGSLGGPDIPDIDPGRGDLAEGMRLFNESCAGCHATTGKGGVAIGAYAPPLGEATPTQVGEAIRIGPHLMPRFSERLLSDAEVDSIARYVQLTQDPEDRGGWGIGHIGPVPEGLIAWFVAITALLIVARLLGERVGGNRPGRSPGGPDDLDNDRPRRGSGDDLPGGTGDIRRGTADG